jgi:OOP family OmpA-OmpF porin
LLISNQYHPDMKSYASFIVLLLIVAITNSASAQFNIPGKVRNQVNSRANQHVDEAIDKGLDATEEGIEDAATQDKKDEKSTQKQETKETKDARAADSQKTSEKAETSTSQPETPLQSYSKYDFVPGERVIFFEDFSQDAVGDFPALWNTNGSAEVVTTNLFPGNWLQFIGREAVWTDALLNLPENYTIEFDIIPIPGEDGNMSGYAFRLMQANNVRGWDAGTTPGKGGAQLNIEYFGRPGLNTWLNNSDCQALSLSSNKEGEEYKEIVNKKYHIAVWIQKSRIRVYQEQNKLFDFPKAFPVECLKADRIRFEDGALLVSNIRIAVGAPDLRNKLLTEGKLVSYGIYFDINKDVVKPESYGTLKGIAQVLTENPDVKIQIVGHTDSDGSDAANLDLSKRRAASVKTELTKTFSIDASRIETDGKGEGQPIAPNDTPANKALNRRVEFIKK